MATLRESNLKFMATVGDILRYFNYNPNIEMENLKINDSCDIITLNVYFTNTETARKDFFKFFEHIGYTITEIEGRTDEDYYNSKDYPNGAVIVPEYVTLEFFAEVDEVVYKMESWSLQAKTPMTTPNFTKLAK